MKSIGIKMTLLMGLTLSFVMSLVGTAMGGHFTLPGWLISFAISFAISVIIGLIVPVPKVCGAALKKAGIEPRSFPGHLLDSLISNTIYTPIMTIILVSTMITMARRQAIAAGAPEEALPTIGGALPMSLLICFFVGWLVVFIFQPIYLKLLTRNLPQGGPPQGGRH